MVLSAENIIELPHKTKSKTKSIGHSKTCKTFENFYFEL